MIVTVYSDIPEISTEVVLKAARQLTGWGHRVLCVDFAGGLAPLVGVDPAPAESGIGALLTDFSTDSVRDMDRYVVHTKRLNVVPFNAAHVDWPALYGAGLASLFDACRTAWRQDHDLVLVNAPAGRGDAAGFCLVQLPDVLVALSDGEADLPDLATRVDVARNRLPFDQARLQVIPVAAAIESAPEPAQFAAQFGELFHSWVGRSTRTDLLVDRMTLSLRRGTGPTETTRPQLPPTSRGIRNLAALIAHRLARVDELVYESTYYIKSARARDSISALAVDDEDLADILQDMLRWRLEPDRWPAIAAELSSLTSLVERREPRQIGDVVRSLELAGPVLAEPTATERPIPQNLALVVTSLLRRLTR